jgi:tetratricopeptide (TPR) repeat protein
LFYDSRSYLWRKLEKYPEALEDYNVILSFYSDDIKALVNRAFCYAKLENYQNAINDYTLILQYEKNNTHSLYNRAISYDKIGKFNEVTTYNNPGYCRLYQNH